MSASTAYPFHVPSSLAKVQTQTARRIATTSRTALPGFPTPRSRARKLPPSAPVRTFTPECTLSWWPGRAAAKSHATRSSGTRPDRLRRARRPRFAFRTYGAGWMGHGASCTTTHPSTCPPSLPAACFPSLGRWTWTAQRPTRPPPLPNRSLFTADSDDPGWTASDRMTDSGHWDATAITALSSGQKTPTTLRCTLQRCLWVCSFLSGWVMLPVFHELDN